MLCREVGFDLAFSYSPYILRGPLSLFRPTGPFPLVWHEPAYLCAEFFGDAGEYEVWFDLVRFVVNDDGEVVDEVDETCYGPFAMTMPAGVFVQGRSYPLRVLPFQAPRTSRVPIAGGRGVQRTRCRPLHGGGVPMKKKGHPTHKPGTKYRPQEFSIQELPDPESCLTEEQKKWPRCNTWRPYEPDQQPQPPQAQQPPPALAG